MLIKYLRQIRDLAAGTLKTKTILTNSRGEPLLHPVPYRVPTHPAPGPWPPSVIDDEVIDNLNSRNPLWINEEGTIYGRLTRRILRSTDWWETNEVYIDMNNELDETDHNVLGLMETESRRLVIGSSKGRVYVTDPYDPNTDTHPNVRLVHTFKAGGFTMRFGHCTYKNIVLVGSYGSAFDPDNGIYPNEVILSVDGGETWKLILEADLVTPNAPNLHIHDVEYDPWAHRIWVAVGDGGNANIYYSDDMGETWDTVWPPGKGAMITQIIAFPEVVCFGTDTQPVGVWIWPRHRNNMRGKVLPEDVDKEAVRFGTEGTGELTNIARRRWVVRDKDYQICVMPMAHYRPYAHSAIWATQDGIHWYEIWKDPYPQSDPRSIDFTNVIGPIVGDEERRFIAAFAEGSGKMLRAKLPEWK